MTLPTNEELMTWPYVVGAIVLFVLLVAGMVWYDRNVDELFERNNK